MAFVLDQDLLERIGALDVAGAAGMRLESVTADSREAGPGVAFVAIQGTRADGHEFIPEAVRRGSPLIVAERRPEQDPGRPVVLVGDSRLALALLASADHGEPSSRMTVVGVTGTDGKTSTSMLIEAGLRAAGRRPGLIGTVHYRYGGVVKQAPMTTPDPVMLQEILADMEAAGTDSVVMEVSSHALDQRRVDGCRFDCAVFTNLTRDHLDYHRTAAAYEDAKLSLFNRVLPSNPDAAGAVVNADDPLSNRIATECPLRVVGFSLVTGTADIHPLSAEYDLEGTTAMVRTPWGDLDVRTRLVGSHNLANIMAALGTGGLLELDVGAFASGVSGLERIPGRLERVEGRRPVKVFVDYAHTPKALEGVIKVMRPLVRGSRLTVVMGAGGDRDRGKRPLMGRAAVLGADRVVVTSDNPRTEDPLAIIDDILDGIRRAEAEGLKVAPYTVEPDRREAIRTAIRESRDGDVVLVAGKGHEDYQILGTRRIHFSDVEVAGELLDAD